MSPFLGSLSLSLVACLTAAQAPPTAELGSPTLELTIGIGDRFLEGDPIRFRTTIENASKPCWWALIDPVVAPRPDGDRPFSIVEIELRDSSGAAIPIQHRAIGLARAIGPGELLTLNCGAFFGEWMQIGDQANAYWRNVLPPGQYSLTVTMHLRVRSYFEAHPELLAAEALRRSRAQDVLLSTLVNATLRSESFGFRVDSKSKAER